MAEKTRRLGMSSGSELEEFATSCSYNLNVSDINASADKNIVPYSKITKVIVHAEAYQTISLGSTKSDMRIYFRKNTSTANATLTLLAEYESVPKKQWTTFEADVTSRFVTNGSNLGHVNVSDVGVLTFFHQAVVVRTLKLRECYVRWYWTTPTFVISLTAGTGGTVSGAGTYEVDSTATIKATPSAGYRFVKWSDGNTNAERQITITSSEISANVTNRSYTAVFELDKINKIYIGTSQPKKIYVGTQEVKAVYIGTTKVYG